MPKRPEKMTGFWNWPKNLGNLADQGWVALLPYMLTMKVESLNSHRLNPLRSDIPAQALQMVGDILNTGIRDDFPVNVEGRAFALT